MQIKCFYSWQSDRPNNENRGFIQTTLEKALKRLNGSATEGLEYLVDRDTCGVYGSPSIADTIFEKIRSCHVFIADVTLVGSSNKRSFCNPNVLLELGYAISQVGWPNIILIYNRKYGEINDLPFDLRGRRIITFDSESKPELLPSLSAIFRQISDSFETGNSNSDEKCGWLGSWNNNSQTGVYGYELQIFDVDEFGFIFDLRVYSGAHSGHVSGYAKLITRETAIASMSAGQGSKFCKLAFNLRKTEQIDFIDVEEISGCTHFHGVAVGFTGAYSKRKTYEVFTQMERRKLLQLLGKYYPQFIDRINVYSAPEDDGTEMRVFAGWITGMLSIHEAILCINERCEMIVGLMIDCRLMAFTNSKEWRRLPPNVFSNWVADRGGKIVYKRPYEYESVS